MIRQKLWICIVILSTLATTQRADATLNVDVLDASIPAGGSGFVDVVISGDVNDKFLAFEFEFLIVPSGPVSSSLRFANPQMEAQLRSPSIMPTYVFSGNSSNVVSNLPMGNVTSTIRYVGSDTTASLTDAIVMDPRLLLRLDLESVVPSGVDAIGDKFELSFVTLTENFINSAQIVVPFAASTGLVTVNAAAVPEPGSLLLLAAASCGFMIYRRRRLILRP